MVVRVGTAMPTIWQALRSPSRGEVTIMGGSGVRGFGTARGSLLEKNKSLPHISKEAVVRYRRFPTIFCRQDPSSAGPDGDCGPGGGCGKPGAHVARGWRAAARIGDGTD